jgi:hypothetical protein
MPLINPITIYEDLGRKAGTAAKRRDMATANFHGQWLTRAIALESAENKSLCREAYNAAYRKEATPRPH